MRAVAGERAALRWVLPAVVALAATGGCRGGNDVPSAATVPEVGPTTTMPADEWAVPEVIDAAYVERVLAELDRIDGEAARIIVAEGELVPAAVDRMRAIYGTAELNFQFELWGEYIADDFEGFRRPPGDRKRSVRALEASEDDCIAVVAMQDNAAIAAATVPVVEVALELRPAERAHDPHGLNPTGWSVSNESSDPSAAGRYCT